MPTPGAKCVCARCGHTSRHVLPLVNDGETCRNAHAVCGILSTATILAALYVEGAIALRLKRRAKEVVERAYMRDTMHPAGNGSYDQHLT